MKGFIQRKCATQETNCQIGQFNKENAVPAVDVNSLKPKGTSVAHSHNKVKLSSKGNTKLSPHEPNTILKLAQQPPTSFLTPPSQNEGIPLYTTLPPNTFPQHRPLESTLTPTDSQPEYLRNTPKSSPQLTRPPGPTTNHPLENTRSQHEHSCVPVGKHTDIMQETPSLKDGSPTKVGELLVSHLDRANKPIPKRVSWRSPQVLQSPEKPWSLTLTETEVIKQQKRGSLGLQSELSPGDLDSSYSLLDEDGLSFEHHLLKESLEANMPSLSPVLRSLPSLCSATPNVDKLLQRKVHRRRPSDRQLSHSRPMTAEFNECPLVLIPDECTQNELNCSKQSTEEQQTADEQQGTEKQQTGNKTTVGSDGEFTPNHISLASHRFGSGSGGQAGLKVHSCSGKVLSVKNVNMADDVSVGNIEKGYISEVPVNTSEKSVTGNDKTSKSATTATTATTAASKKPVRQKRRRGRPRKKVLSPSNNDSSANLQSESLQRGSNSKLGSIDDTAGLEAIEITENKENSFKASPQKTSRKKRKADAVVPYLPMRLTRRTAALQKAFLEEAGVDVLSTPASKRPKLSSPLAENSENLDLQENIVENAVVQEEECMQNPNERLSPPGTNMNANNADASAEGGSSPPMSPKEPATKVR